MKGIVAPEIGPKSFGTLEKHWTGTLIAVAPKSVKPGARGLVSLIEIGLIIAMSLSVSHEDKNTTSARYSEFQTTIVD